MTMKNSLHCLSMRSCIYGRKNLPNNLFYRFCFCTAQKSVFLATTFLGRQFICWVVSYIVNTLASNSVFKIENEVVLSTLRTTPYCYLDYLFFYISGGLNFPVIYTLQFPYPQKLGVHFARKHKRK